MKKYIEWLTNTNILLFSFVLCIISLFLKTLVFSFRYIFNIQDISFRERLITQNFKISIGTIIDTVIIAPVLETLVFQSLFFIIMKRFNINKWIIILISSISFGVYHNYSIFYMINTSLIGFVFIYMYIQRANAEKKPALSIIVAHSMINLIIIITTFITHYYMYGTLF